MYKDILCLRIITVSIYIHFSLNFFSIIYNFNLFITDKFRIFCIKIVEKKNAKNKRNFKFTRILHLQLLFITNNRWILLIRLEKLTHNAHNIMIVILILIYEIYIHILYY